MTLNPTARATARRNVVDRFDRFLNALSLPDASRTAVSCFGSVTP
jgi:hypothetical protein